MHGFQREELVFGSALVNAYELERRDAHYPRVILSDRVTQDLKRFRQWYAIPGLDEVKLLDDPNAWTSGGCDFATATRVQFGVSRLAAPQGSYRHRYDRSRAKPSFLRKRSVRVREY